jgi:hypothetical protein
MFPNQWADLNLALKNLSMLMSESGHQLPLETRADSVRCAPISGPYLKR